MEFGSAPRVLTGAAVNVKESWTMLRMDVRLLCSRYIVALLQSLYGIHVLPAKQEAVVQVLKCGSVFQSYSFLVPLCYSQSHPKLKS